MTEKFDLYNIKREYVERAANLMERYFGDVVLDLENIEKMKINDIIFFIVQPNCTHSATPENYDQKRDDYAKVWGNYVVFRIERIDDKFYTIKNWDILDKMSYDTKNQELIQKYKDFVLS